MRASLRDSHLVCVTGTASWHYEQISNYDSQTHAQTPISVIFDFLSLPRHEGNSNGMKKKKIEAERRTKVNDNVMNVLT